MPFEKTLEGIIFLETCKTNIPLITFTFREEVYFMLIMGKLCTSHRIVLRYHGGGDFRYTINYFYLFFE